MVQRLICGLALLTVVAASTTPCAAQDKAAGKLHRWEHISFPRLPLSDERASVPDVTLKNQHEQGLALVLAYFVPGPGVQLPGYKAPPEPEDVPVRFHFPDGRVVTAAGGLGFGSGLGDLRGWDHFLEFSVPWDRNALDEAWIELQLEGRVFWLEVPYGFVRNPAEPLAPVEPNRGLPSLAPAMADLGEPDYVVPWLNVHYDLGEIQNHWGLSFNQGNPFDAEAEIVLFRNDSQVGKSMFLWDLHSPKTSIRLRDVEGYDLYSICMSLRLHDDGMRRSDCFRFLTHGGDINGRDWGTATITVDDRSYECVMPSSLFKYVHGRADRHTGHLK